MSRWFPVSIACLCLFATGLRAETIEIALPGLLGDYAADGNTTTRSVAFQLPRLPEVIHGVSIRIESTTNLGVANCHGVGTADLWPMEYIGDMAGSAENAWIAMPEPSYIWGPFETTAAFEPLTETATWDFLLDGEDEISLSGGPLAQLRLCDPLLIPTGSLLDAVLIIDADFSLPVVQYTWGRIKALYR